MLSEEQEDLNTKLSNQSADSPRQIINFDPTTTNIQTKEDLISVISSYFSYINENEGTPTFTGLALLLGITRNKLKNGLPPNNSFTPMIEKAKQYIVDYAEKQLFQPKSAAGVQFWLKNNDDWVDKTDISISKPKTMVDILNEIEKQNQQPQVVDGEVIPNNTDISQQNNKFSNSYDNSNESGDFFKHGENAIPTPEQSIASEEQGVAVEKPLQDYR